MIKVPFQVNPNKFNRVEIRTIWRVFINNNAMPLEEKSDSLCSMHWSIVFLEFGIANSAVDVVNDWEEESLEEATIDKCVDRTNNQGNKCPTGFPQKTAPDHQGCSLSLFTA